jgi:MoaA/NifB/PqqE/SkfB family radical SAM enzyme
MVAKYLEFVKAPPSVSFRKVNLDITYRCNNNCRHCWQRLPVDAREADKEITLGEIERLAIEARSLGCLRWQISGGEPLIRKDFSEILGIIKKYGKSYELLTNATLITPKIAKLLKDDGEKHISLYGATAEVYDQVTRNPGSFRQMIRGISYLKEAGVRFSIQIIPLQSNYHQLEKMIELADSLSAYNQIGLSWVVAPASDNADIIKEVLSQRLPPEAMLKVNSRNVNLNYMYNQGTYEGEKKLKAVHDRRFFACACGNSELHIDPYFTVSLCNAIIDSRLRYNLRSGRIIKYLREFAPSLPMKINPGSKYLRNCASCRLKKFCCWCPARAYLECRDYSAKIPYLCLMGKENEKMWDSWRDNCRRYFSIAGINIRVESELPFSKNTFNPKFKSFQSGKTKRVDIKIRHHFTRGDILSRHQGFTEVYRKAPWIIYKKDGQFIYKDYPASSEEASRYTAIVSDGYKDIRVYHRKDIIFKKGNSPSLSFFPTDQIILAQVLAGMQGLILHSCGVIINGKGYIFVGESGAGKSTVSKLLKGRCELLCDDRTIIRKVKTGFKVYGTWCHGEVPEVSSSFAILKAVIFLRKSRLNRLAKVKDKKEVLYSVIPRIIKPLLSERWRDSVISLAGELSENIPAYELFFNKNADIATMLKKIPE